ncbi:carbohydrate-binding domain-containing protein [Paenibacillus sp. y28]|uniref:carbohydrate-binding domain-containing protein n=1 Tax=Paenibacillus sp. y28 TaxID=3129110 RepID=UPI00301ADEE6
MDANKMKLFTAILSMAVLLSACNSTAGTQQVDAPSASQTAQTDLAQIKTASAAASSTAQAIEKATYKDNDYAADWTKENPVKITLNEAGAAIEGTGASVQDQTVTISAAGTYVLSGTWKNGQIVVDVPEKDEVRLVLNGVTLERSGSAPLYIKQADKAILTLQEGTRNTVSDGSAAGTAAASEDELNAAIYSKADLTVNGTGTLVVHGHVNDGLASKDNLKITGGTLEIYAADDGIIGRDLLAVKDGSITVQAGGDGLKTTNDTDESKGNVVIEGGTFAITSGADGLQSARGIRIDGGTYAIVTGGGSAKAVMKAETNGPGGPGGMGGRNTAQQQTTASDETTSTKAVKAASSLIINNGNFTLDSLSDGLHSNDSLMISGGQITISAGDDGLHADGSLTIAGGTIDIVKSYEGIEGSLITIADGTIHVVSSDDGVNISGDGDKLVINGGSLTVDAAGDGLDSNGSIVMTGGAVVVYGPTANNNGALDYDKTFDISGGTLIAAGSSGMAMATSESSAQMTVLMTYSSSQAAGTVTTIKDSSGAVIASATPTKSYQSIVFSSPGLKKDETYSLYSGDKKLVDFNMTASVTWLNESGVTAARSMGPGGMGGGMRGNGPQNQFRNQPQKQ